MKIGDKVHLTDERVIRGVSPMWIADAYGFIVEIDTKNDSVDVEFHHRDGSKRLTHEWSPLSFGITLEDEE
jgi:hypothetical protein